MRPRRTIPDDLPPMRVNTVTMVVTGIGVWVAVLIASVVMQLMGLSIPARTVEVCVAGVVLGLLALAWAVPQRRRDLRAEAARRSGESTPGADRRAPAAGSGDDGPRDRRPGARPPHALPEEHHP
ncbi:DUF2530 domain-containing protein [Georgenia faecalis]|uniref:DUF2530 domain-containing protein n=1 Tax=Georgenia faecalis TaxID=2483799 RepID=UPI0013DEA8FD|nr:DUF2530 domain-containing protein [Georgenia faecalis]